MVDRHLDEIVEKDRIEVDILLKLVFSQGVEDLLSIVCDRFFEVENELARGQKVRFFTGRRWDKHVHLGFAFDADPELTFGHPSELVTMDTVLARNVGSFRQRVLKRFHGPINYQLHTSDADLLALANDSFPFEDPLFVNYSVHGVSL